MADGKRKKLKNCCEWEVFEDGVTGLFAAKGMEALIDWDQAREAWGRYAATPGEFFAHVMRENGRDGDYLFAQNLREGKRSRPQPPGEA